MYLGGASVLCVPDDEEVATCCAGRADESRFPPPNDGRIDPTGPGTTTT
jgi:hypothetical protein